MNKRPATLTRLQQYTRDIARVQAQIKSTVQRGLKSPDDRVQRFCAIRGRELLLELARLTFEAQGLQMQLEQQLLGPLAGVALNWTKPYYYYAPELRQWAKVRGTASGFVFEAITAEHQGVLVYLDAFELTGQWTTSTATEYRAMLKHLLDTGGIVWNQVHEATLTQQV